MEVDDWISVTRLGSDYEHELSPSTNRQRHRQVSFTGVEYPWTPGAPPDMVQPRPLAFKHGKKLTHATVDSNGLAAPIGFIGTAMLHSGNRKVYVIIGVCWLGETDQWGVIMKARGENIDIVRPFSHVRGKRSNGELRYIIL